MVSFFAQILILILLLSAPSCSELGRYDLSYTFRNQSVILAQTELNYFFGYRTIYGSSSSIILPTDTMLRCEGERSCSQVSSIVFIGNDGRLYCEGSYSCASIQRIESLRNYTAILFASGYKSLEFSFIDTQFANVYCTGQMSCSNSEINAGQSVYGSGAYSLMNATIQSIGKISVHLRGYYAAYGATIHCNVGHECTINCESITGCSRMYLICDGMCKVNTISSNAMLPIADISEIKSTLIPFLNHSIPSDVNCSYTFNDYEQNQEGVNIFQNAYSGPICCRGTGSCRDIDISYFLPSNETKDRAAILQCGGSTSCAITTYKTKVDVHGDVYCLAHEACKNKNIISNATNLYCTGMYSCSGANLMSGPMPSDFVYRSGYYPNPTAFINIWCNAQLSCAHATINIERGYLLSLYLLGSDSGDSSDVYCNGGSICKIYCYARNSCKLLQLDGDGIFIVECDELSLCPIGYTQEPTKHPMFQPTTSSPTNTPIETTFYETNITQLEMETTATSILNGSASDDVIENVESELGSSISIEVIIPLTCGIILVFCSLLVVLYFGRSNYLKKTNEETTHRNIEIMTQETDKVQKKSDEQIVSGYNEGNDNETDDELYDDKCGETERGCNEMAVATPGITKIEKVTVCGGDNI